MLALFVKFGKVIKTIKERREGIQMALATVQANSLKIADIAEITEGISYVEFTSVIDEHSYARSADIYCTLVIKGVLNMDSTKKILGDESKKMLEWSLVASNSADCYKAVEVSYTHNDVTTKYKFSHAFPVSYKEENADQEKRFTLVVRQKKDRLADIVVE